MESSSKQISLDAKPAGTQAAESPKTSYQYDEAELQEIMKAEQGRFEMELLVGDENDLHKRKKTCTKNPNHDKFVSIKDFNLHHFPERYQDPDLVDLVLAKADLTVRVVVGYTSQARPTGYPCHQLRGVSGLRRFGSGWIECVLPPSKGEEGCPCPKCLHSSSPAREWGQIMINTAKHVVFDTDEARHSTFNLFYDGEDAVSSIQSLTGMWVHSSDSERDHSLIACVTHDLELVRKLKDMYSHYDKLHTKISRKYDNTNNDDQLTFIVSHPHGCSKQVSVGEWVYRLQCINEYHTRYLYTTCTCPGCSGAPVFLFGRFGWWMTNHPHSGHYGPDDLNKTTDELNMSGGAVDY